MAIDVALKLKNINFNEVNLTLVDGMSIDKLKIRYNWIFNATIKDAIIGEDDYGLVWYKGTWICGEWYDGTWYSGDFLNGRWKNGKFYSYRLNKFDIINGNLNIIENNKKYSVFHKGTWENGDFYNGIFGVETVKWSDYQPYNPNNPDEENDITNNTMDTTVWLNGNFYKGSISHTIWYNGNFYNGSMENCQWIGGKFYNGEFDGLNWFNGTFMGGDFVFGNWFNGTFTSFNDNVQSRFGFTKDNEPKVTLTPADGESSYNTPYYISQDNRDISWGFPTDFYDVMREPEENVVIGDEVIFSGTYNVNTLIIHNWNFDIPDDAEIKGIEAKFGIYRKTHQGIQTAEVKENVVALSDVSDMSRLYENKSTGSLAPELPSSTPYNFNFQYGSINDEWGNNNWTPEIINSDDFSLNINFNITKTGNTSQIVSVAFSGAMLKIYYSYNEKNYDYQKCVWFNGEFNSGEFHSGRFLDSDGNSIPSKNHNISTWYNGNFNNGKYYGGKFLRGSFNNGEWYSGHFGTNSSKCVWNNGIWYNGYWINGDFYNGEFKNGLCRNIYIYGGKFGR